MRYLMKIKYNGAAYHGWQVQNNAQSVQTVVQDALEKVLNTRPNVTGCSRTDSGVHAKCFCFHFDANTNIPANNLVYAINHYLPNDIAAFECRAVTDDFHARYSVKSKEYVYKIYNGALRDPFYESGYTHIDIPLDEKKMDKAAKQFIGKYDFSAFCAAGSSVEDTVRNIMDASVTRQGDEVIFTVRADGFLYNMVRIMAGTLLYVSYGKINENDIINIIESKDRKRAGITAPADGLYLNDVEY